MPPEICKNTTEFGYTYRDQYIRYEVADNVWIVPFLSHAVKHVSLKDAIAAIDAFYKKQVMDVEAVYRFHDDSDPTIVRITGLTGDGSVWFRNERGTREKAKLDRFRLITEEARAKLIPIRGALIALAEQRKVLIEQRKAVLDNDCLPFTLENVQKLKKQ